MHEKAHTTITILKIMMMVVRRWALHLASRVNREDEVVRRWVYIPLYDLLSCLESNGRHFCIYIFWRMELETGKGLGERRRAFLEW